MGFSKQGLKEALKYKGRDFEEPFAERSEKAQVILMCKEVLIFTIP